MSRAFAATKNRSSGSLRLAGAMLLFLASFGGSAGRTAQAQDARLERAVAQTQRLGVLEEAIGALESRLGEDRDALQVAQRRLARLTEIASAPPASLPDTPAALRIELHQRREQLSAWRERRSLAESLSRLLALRLESLNELRQSINAAREAIAELLALQAEVEAAQIKDIPDPGTLARKLAQFVQLDEKTALEQKAIKEQKSAADAEVAAATAGEARLSEQVTIVQDRLKDRERRDELQAEVQGRDEAALSGLLVARLLERRAAGFRVYQLSNAADTALDNFNKAELSAAQVEVPDPKNLVLEARLPKLRKLERELKVKEQLLSFFNRRLELLNLLPPRLKSATEAIAEARAAIATALQVETEVEVLIEAGAQRKGPDENPGVSFDRKALEAIEARFAVAIRRLQKERLPALEADRSLVQREQKKIELNLPPLRESFVRERDLATFVEEVASLESAQLKAEYAANIAIVTSSVVAVKALDDRVIALNTALKNRRAGLLAREMPSTRRTRREFPKLREKVAEELEGIAGIKRSNGNEPKPKSGAASSAQQSPSSSAANGANSASASSQFEDLLAEQVEVAAQLDFFKLIRGELEQLQAARASLDSERLELQATIGRTLAAARRAFGCAEELQIRVGTGALPSKELPSGLADLSLRSTVESLAARNIDLTRATKAPTESYFGHDLELLDERVALNQRRRAVLDKAIGLYRSREGHLEAARKEREKLSELEQRVLAEAAEARQNGQMTWWMSWISLLDNEAVKQIEKELASEFLKLQDVERRIALFAQAQDRSSELIALAREYSSLLTNESEHVREAVEAVRRSVTLIEGRVTAALKPAEAPAILAELARKTGVELAVPNPAKASDLPILIDEVFNARLIGLTHERLLRFVEERSGEAGLAKAITVLEDDRAGFATESRRLQEERALLIGHELSGPGALAGAREGSRIFRYGEIGVLQAQALDARLARLKASALSLVFIPLLALTFLSIARVSMNRLVQAIRRKPKDAEEEAAQKNIETLLQVFGAALRSVVMILAGIYLLSTFGIDVTPLVASAGVVGLAIGFGAQSLVRDFFAGFFILLENQLNLGDYVLINDIEGYVESVSLRVTILRDARGDRHFIPNGSINRVTNQTQLFSGMLVEVGVSYSEDPDRVIEVLREITRAMYEDERWSLRFHAPPIVQGLQSLADSSCNYRISIKTKPGAQWETARELRRRIKKGFDEAGVEIPFPQRVVHHRYQNPPPAPTPAPAEPVAVPQPGPAEAPTRSAVEAEKPGPSAGEAGS